MGLTARRALILLLAAAGLVGVALLSLRVGSVALPAGTVVDALTAFDGSTEHLIVRQVRVPRTLVGLGVGSALAVAGVLLQAVTRNALAAPEILGLNAGAAFAIVLAIHVLGVVTPVGYVWFAFAGAAGALVVVSLLGAAGRGGATPLKVALAGVVVAALLGSWTSAVLVLDAQTLDVVRFWLAGSLSGRTMAVVTQLAPLVLAGLAGAALLAPQLNTLVLGDDLARGLGQRTMRVRVASGAVVVLLAGAAVAAAGPIAFVGLAVPHLARWAVGSDQRWLVAASALLGPALLLGADVVGRIVARPGEVQVGIVTAIVGAPVLIALARTRRLEAA